MRNVLMTLRKWLSFLSGYNGRVLWIEAILFSVILGALPYLWPIASLIFIGLTWELNQSKGSLYTIYILSVGWALLGGLFSYFLGGEGWAVASGSIVFLSSLGVHFRYLEQPIIASSKVLESKPKMAFGRFNLN